MHKIVSVKFHKTNDESPSRAPVTLETPVVGTLVEKEEDAQQKREETMEIATAE